MLQILFIMCQSIDNLLKTFFKADTKSLFLKVFPKSCLFVSLPSDFLQFQKQFMTKSETRFDLKPLENH